MYFRNFYAVSISVAYSTGIPVCTEECKDNKPRILVESIGEFTEMHNIADGIIAYSFLSQHSCLVSRIQLRFSDSGYLPYRTVALRATPCYEPTSSRYSTRTILVPVLASSCSTTMPGQVPPGRRMPEQGLTLCRRMQGLETTDFSRISR